MSAHRMAADATLSSAVNVLADPGDWVSSNYIEEPTGLTSVCIVTTTGSETRRLPVATNLTPGQAVSITGQANTLEVEDSGGSSVCTLSAGEVGICVVGASGSTYEWQGVVVKSSAN